MISDSPDSGLCSHTAGSFGGQHYVSHHSEAGELKPASLAASAGATPTREFCHLILAAWVLEKQVTGAIICTWQSKPTQTLKGTAGPGSATLFIRQLILRLSAEATRAGPGREAVLSTIQYRPTNIVELMLCRRHCEWLQRKRQVRDSSCL